jgi:uncharacterized protein (DUF427 family)
MNKATWNGITLAESNECIKLENNYYFPIDSVKSEYLILSDYRTQCSWKGTAHYYHIVVNSLRNENAAWFYPDPKNEASQIRGYVAFWRGVIVT